MTVKHKRPNEKLILDKPSYDGDFDLQVTIERMGLSFAALVARLAIFAPSEDVKMRMEKRDKTRHATVYPRMRRKRQGEQRNRQAGLDDNTYANIAIKRACGVQGKSGVRGKIKNYNACHIYEESCYDKLYHTALPNLVLLPRAIASLTDFDKNVKQCLQYRSWELYKWYPENMKKPPTKPKDYPKEKEWRQDLNLGIMY